MLKKSGGATIAAMAVLTKMAIFQCLSSCGTVTKPTRTSTITNHGMSAIRPNITVIITKSWW